MWHQHTLEATKASLVVPSLPLKQKQYPGGHQSTPVATTTLEICLSSAKPGSRQSHPCCPQPTLVVSIAIAGGPQQTTVVSSHHYGCPQLIYAQHSCRHNSNLMVLCPTHHSTQEVLSQPFIHQILCWSSTYYCDHYIQPVGP